MMPNDRELFCLRCNGKMRFAGREQFQLGEESPFSGVFAVMTSTSTCMDIYKCCECGKIEFFDPAPVKSSAPTATDWTCTECGTHNNRRVKTCQGCGINREWLKNQQAKGKY